MKKNLTVEDSWTCNKLLLFFVHENLKLNPI